MTILLALLAFFLIHQGLTGVRAQARTAEAHHRLGQLEFPLVAMPITSAASMPDTLPIDVEWTERAQ